MRTPDVVMQEIHQTRRDLMNGPDHLRSTELAAERASDAATLAYNKVLMRVEGSIPVKEAQAHEATVAERDAAFVARAAYNHTKARIKALEASLMSLQAELKWLREEGA